MKTYFNRRQFIGGMGAAAGGLMLPGSLTRPAFAETYPARDLMWLVHQAPGGLIDSTTRVALPYLERHGFGATIEYLSGASGRIARAELFNARPDGHMIMTDRSEERRRGKECVRTGRSRLSPPPEKKKPPYHTQTNRFK